MDLQQSFNWPTSQSVNAAYDYAVDFWQRSLLYADVMRERGNQYLEHLAQVTPHVLSFEAEIVMFGNSLERPVNYGLARIIPPEGVEIDPRKRPFVVVDPRAGHGPGIGGFKADSEIGAALGAGHPCYLVGFVPDPVPGQTVEDVMRAEAAFLERVIALHPESEGKPVVIGNCQAGWQILMTAAVRPELFGPIIIAGSPVSYWAGWSGQQPDALQWRTARRQLADGLDRRSRCRPLRRRLAGSEFREPQPGQYPLDQAVRPLLEGRYRAGALSRLREVLGRPCFPERCRDAVHRRQPVHRKQAVHGPTHDVGRDPHRLAQHPVPHPGVLFKRRQHSPPPQALGWITDLYLDDEDVRAHDQTIIYALHDSIGHLGIFVSGSVGRKEHKEFEANIDFLDVLPSGIYQAKLQDKGPDTLNPDLAYGDYVLSLERRSVADVREIVRPDVESDRRFAAVARISEINLSLYRSFVQPWVRASGHTAIGAAI